MNSCSLCASTSCSDRRFCLRMARRRSPTCRLYTEGASPSIIVIRIPAHFSWPTSRPPLPPSVRLPHSTCLIPVTRCGTDRASPRRRRRSRRAGCCCRARRARAPRRVRSATTRLRVRWRSKSSDGAIWRPPGSATTQVGSTASAATGPSIRIGQIRATLPARLDRRPAPPARVGQPFARSSHRVVESFGVEQHEPVDTEFGELLHHPVEPIALRDRGGDRDRSAPADR